MVVKMKITFNDCKKYFICFILYAIIGWCYEVFLEVFVYQWGFSNRGFLFGPYCPVYGFGALIFILTLTKLKNTKIRLWKINITPVLVFCGITAIATGVELVASYLLQIFTGGWLWDYTKYSFNFEGRIALNPSIRFGIGGMVFMYILQPLFEKVVNRFSDKKLNIIFTILLSIISIDLVVKIISMVI